MPQPDNGIRAARGHFNARREFRPSTDSRILDAAEFTAGRKEFKATLRENAAGKYVVVEEHSRGRVSRVVLDVDGLPGFIAALESLDTHARSR